MKPENVLLKQQGRSGIKVSLLFLSRSQPSETNRANSRETKTKAEEITFLRPPTEPRGLAPLSSDCGCKWLRKLNALVNYEAGRGFGWG